MTRRPKAPPPGEAASDDLSAELRATFGSNLRAARERAGMSLQAVASQVGSDAGYVSRIERGGINVTFGTAARLAQAVGADVRDLLGLCHGSRPRKSPRS